MALSGGLNKMNSQPNNNTLMRSKQFKKQQNNQPRALRQQCSPIDDEFSPYEQYKTQNKRCEKIAKKYFIFYTTNNSTREVSKKTFSSVKGKVLVQGDEIIRIVGLSEKRTFAHVSRTVNFNAQGLKDVWKGLLTTVGGLQFIGKAYTKVQEGKVWESVKDFLPGDKIKTFFLDVFSVLLDVINNITNATWVSLVSLLVNFFRLVSRDFAFYAQGLDAMLCSAATLFLPQRLFEFIKRINVFSNTKLLDDPSMFYKIFEVVLDFISSCLSYIPYFPTVFSKLKDYLAQAKDYVSFFRFKKLVQLADSVLQNPRLAVDKNFREAYKTMKLELQLKYDLIEWGKRSAVVSQGLHIIERVAKILNSYENSLRVEPSCFVFEGPPGCLKSVLMNGVIGALGQSCYYHAIKSITDGKDWYDSYNNEDIFSMDDVGQQGISQWRSIINMVSPVKLPLDCAEASLKDTKFFSSEKILLTTNCFTQLTGLTKSDCITNLDALWRRAYVFKFETARVGGLLVGSISLVHFDTSRIESPYYTPNSQLFLPGFSKDVREYLSSIGVKMKTSVTLSAQDIDQQASIIAWMADIISVVSAVKKQQQIQNDVGLKLDVINTKRFFDNEGNIRVQPTTSFKAQGNFSVDLGDCSGVVPSEFGNTAFFSQRSFDISSVVSDLDDFEEHLQIIPDPVPRVREFFEENSCKEYVSDVISSIGTVPNECDSGIVEYLVISTIVVLIIAILCTLLTVLFYKPQGKSSDIGDWVGQGGYHPSVNFVAKQVLKILIKSESGVEIITNALVSGHCILLNSHNVLNSLVYVTVYKDMDRKCILLDNCKYEVIYNNHSSDVCILRSVLNMAIPFRNLSKHFKIKHKEDVIIKDCYLLNQKIIPLHTISSSFRRASVYKFDYKNSKVPAFVNSFKETDIFYSLQEDGMCGSVVFDVQHGILGLHSAGSPAVNVGVSLFIDNVVIEDIKNILQEDDKFIMSEDISEKVQDDFSGVKLDVKVNLATPKESSIIPSPFCGVFPCTRSPANLSKFGPHTVKDVAKKSFKPAGSVDFSEMAFMRRAIASIVDEFQDISEEEVVAGNDWLAGLNKDSSNGYKCAPLKSEYVDFPNKKFTERFRVELSEFEENVKKGVFVLDDSLWAETLKDELRGDEKLGVPRSFRVSRVHIQVWTKMIFGNLVSNLMKTRDYHGICIGINPFTEWEVMYTKLQRNIDKVWASDIKEWDGRMLPQVQTELVEVLLDKYTGSHKEMAKYLLTSIIYCVVGVNDDVYLTNHSMPSGSFLTAMFNSLVNKSYKAMWYYRYAEDKTIYGFYHNILDYVYGDDTLNCNLSNDSNLNAITMLRFFESIGLSCTNSVKQPIISEYDDIANVTFLKRYFRYHPKIGRIVCPLDLNTIYSTLSWCDGSKVMTDVVNDKLNSFQREIYLHYPLYKENVLKLLDACEQRSWPLKIIPESAIIDLYTKEPHVWKGVGYSDSKYM